MIAEPDRDVERDQHPGGDRGVGGPQPAVRRPAGPGRLRTLLDAVGALEADRGRPHAVGADHLAAPLAADVGLAVGVPVAGRHARLRRLRAAGPGQGQAPMISTDSMTTGSVGRSPAAVLRLADRVDHVARGLVGDLAEDRVLHVQPRGRPGGDEELRAVGARAGVGHGQQVGLVEDQLGVRLVLERVAGAAGAGAERAAALDHEAVDDPVEGQAVVERAAAAVAGVVGLLAGREAGEVRDRLGRVVGEQVQGDVTPVGLEDGLRLSHDCLSALPYAGRRAAVGGTWGARVGTAPADRSACLSILSRVASGPHWPPLGGAWLSDVSRTRRSAEEVEKMAFRKKKTLLDQASDYIDQVRPQVESAVASALDAAEDFYEKTARPALLDAQGQGRPRAGRRPRQGGALRRRGARPRRCGPRRRPRPGRPRARRRCATRPLPTSPTRAAARPEAAAAAKEAADARVAQLQRRGAPEEGQQAQEGRALRRPRRCRRLRRQEAPGRRPERQLAVVVRPDPRADAGQARRPRPSPPTTPVPPAPARRSPTRPTSRKPATTPDDPAEVVDLENPVEDKL